MGTSDIILGDEVSRYRMIVGCENWSVTLKRFDFHFDMSTMGRYNYTPMKGNIGDMIRSVGYHKN